MAESIFRRIRSRVRGVIVQRKPGILQEVLQAPDDATLFLNGDFEWTVPPGTGGGITQLTGDVTAGPGSGSQAATLAASGVSAGTYGNATNVPQVTVDAKGRVTAAGNVAISGVGITQLTGDVTAGPGTGSVATTLASNLKRGSVGATFDGGGSVLTVGAKLYVPAISSFTISRSQVECYPSGDVEFDIKKADFATFPTLTSIVASAPPSVSGSQKSEDTTLTGWTTGVTTGDVFEISVTLATDVTFAVVTLTGPKT